MSYMEEEEEEEEEEKGPPVHRKVMSFAFLAVATVISLDEIEENCVQSA